ncbi:hypothetical protein PInf_018179 [Phytophthora infestans]|nr:hypothetical protein PInf_018179 [Phytophthora infestans]
MYNWGLGVLGRFPSISGIKVSEQPLTKDSMDEIKAYLNAHPTEFVVTLIASDVAFCGGIGLDALLQHWWVLTQYFPDVDIKLNNLQQITDDSVHRGRHTLLPQRSHCGNLRSDAVIGFFGAFGKTLGNYGMYNWGLGVLGRFPSISGIKVSEQPLTKDSMDEIKAYLNAHPTEFVVVYLETGVDIKRSDKIDAIDTLLTDTCGDLPVPVMSLDVLAKGMWAGGSISESSSAGHQVLDLTSTKTGVCIQSVRHVHGQEAADGRVHRDAKRLINDITITPTQTGSGRGQNSFVFPSIYDGS